MSLIGENAKPYIAASASKIIIYNVLREGRWKTNETEILKTKKSDFFKLNIVFPFAENNVVTRVEFTGPPQPPLLPLTVRVLEW